jgi:hypothetical protein
MSRLGRGADAVHRPDQVAILLAEALRRLGGEQSCLRRKRQPETLAGALAAARMR